MIRLGVTSKDIPQDFQMFGDVWEFYKKYYHPPKKDDTEEWDRFIADSHAISEKHDSRMCGDLMLAVIREIERRSGGNEK